MEAFPEREARVEKCPTCGAAANVTYHNIFVDQQAAPVRQVVDSVACCSSACDNYNESAAILLGPLESSGASRRDKRIRAAFERMPGEDAYEWVARTHRALPARELPRLMMLRQRDRAQVEAIQLLAQLRMVSWTRGLTYGTFFLGVCTIVAAFIVK